MMGKSKELYEDLCNRTVGKHTDGGGHRRISKLVNVPVSTVGPIIQLWKEHHFTINWSQPGAPHKISDGGVKRVIRKAVKQPRTTSESPGVSKYHCFKENNKKGTQPPRPACTLSTRDSISQKKSVLKLISSLLHNIWTRL